MFTTTTLAVGMHSLTASYSGDGLDMPSNSPVLNQTVNIGAATTTLVSSLNPSMFGQSVTLTATVSSTAATGTVAFKDGANTLGMGNVSNGMATFTTSALAVGQHSLTAIYSGDANDASSSSAALTQTVNQVTNHYNADIVAESVDLRAERYLHGNRGAGHGDGQRDV